MLAQQAVTGPWCLESRDSPSPTLIRVPRTVGEPASISEARHPATTLAEAAFLVASLESMNAQSAQLAAMQKSLLGAAQLVNTARAAGV